MAKKRAFVKYTKKGKIIPGSLIVTTSGGHPVDGVYKEVPYDVCCGGGGCNYPEVTGEVNFTTLPENIFNNPITVAGLSILCTNYLPDLTNELSYHNYETTFPPVTLTSLVEIINFLNTTYSSIGTFTLNGNTVNLTTNILYTGGCTTPNAIDLALL